MPLVALKNLQAGREQILKLRIAGRRNKRALQRGVDGFVIRDLVVDIGFVERLARELGKLGALLRRLFAQGFAGVVVLGRDAELFQLGERLFVDRLMIALHVGREGAHVLVAALFLGLLGHGDIQLSGRIGDVSDLRIAWFGAFCREDRSGCAQCGGSKRGG